MAAAAAAASPSLDGRGSLRGQGQDVDNVWMKDRASTTRNVPLLSVSTRHDNHNRNADISATRRDSWTWTLTSFVSFLGAPLADTRPGVVAPTAETATTTTTRARRALSTRSERAEYAKNFALIILTILASLVCLVALVYLLTMLADLYCCCIPGFQPVSPFTGPVDAFAGVEDLPHRIVGGTVARQAGFFGMTRDERRQLLQHVLVKKTFHKEEASESLSIVVGSEDDGLEMVSLAVATTTAATSKTAQDNKTTLPRNLKEKGPVGKESIWPVRRGSTKSKSSEQKEGSSQGEEDDGAVDDESDEKEKEDEKLALLKDYDSSKTCAICIQDYETGDTTLTSRYCAHQFHQDCLLEWLGKGKDLCPCCRTAVWTSEDLRNAAPVVLGPQRVGELVDMARRMMPNASEPVAANATPTTTTPQETPTTVHTTTAAAETARNAAVDHASAAATEALTDAVADNGADFPPEASVEEEERAEAQQRDVAAGKREKEETGRETKDGRQKDKASSEETEEEKAEQDEEQEQNDNDNDDDDKKEKM